MAKNSMLLGLLPFAGLFGRLGIKPVLKRKLIQNPISIICHACALISSWAGLFLEDDKEMLVAGANTMLQIALKLLNKKQKPAGRQVLEDKDASRQRD